MSISLNDMSALARALTEAESAAAKLAEQLSVAKERARILREETIPTLMQELGLSELKLDSGEKISIKQDVYASIPAEHKIDAFNWLNENGFGGLIKVNVLVAFQKGQSDAAEQLREELCSRGLDCDAEESVHAQTLKAFLREQIALGQTLPLEWFGARPVWVAKITRP